MQNMKDGKSPDEMYSMFSMKAAVCSNDPEIVTSLSERQMETKVVYVIMNSK